MTTPDPLQSFLASNELTGQDFLTRFLDAIARIFQGGGEEEAMEKIRKELKRVFACDEISIFVHDPDERPEEGEGDWVLTVPSGFGEGQRVTQAHTKSLPHVEPGRPVGFDAQLPKQLALKTIALAFEEDVFYGCDIERSKMVLIRNPRPEDDLGSGEISVLAIPLRFVSKMDKVLEKARVGVIALYRTPTRRDLAEIEHSLRSLIAHAIVTPACFLKDPVTGLYTERYMREELERQFYLHDFTSGKFKGGIVAGLIDTLNLYKMGLESGGAVSRAEVHQVVSDTIRAVAQCVAKRAKDFPLGPTQDYKGGIAGRIGRDGFGVLLPVLRDREQRMFAFRLSKDVTALPFRGEEVLARGDLTVSLRVIPFGVPGATRPDAIWNLVQAQLQEIRDAQEKVRKDAEALAKVVGTRMALDEEGRWVASGE